MEERSGGRIERCRKENYCVEGDGFWREVEGGWRDKRRRVEQEIDWRIEMDGGNRRRMEERGGVWRDAGRRVEEEEEDVWRTMEKGDRWREGIPVEGMEEGVWRRWRKENGESKYVTPGGGSSSSGGGSSSITPRPPITYPGGSTGGYLVGGGSTSVSGGSGGGSSTGGGGSGIISGGGSGSITGGGSTSSGGGFTIGGGGVVVGGGGSGGSSYGTTQTSHTSPTQRPTDTNVNCDPTGVCYDVSVHCKDTRIVVEVATNEPFNGRIYALGRSETCNIQVINSDQFRLDLSMAGQDCNTQSAGGVYTNTVVIQHHSIVMTKTDKIYKIRCTYDMTSKNITFGMLPIRYCCQPPANVVNPMVLLSTPWYYCQPHGTVVNPMVLLSSPWYYCQRYGHVVNTIVLLSTPLSCCQPPRTVVNPLVLLSTLWYCCQASGTVVKPCVFSSSRDPDMIPITSAPEAPPPRIRILDAALREVETVRIGDTLTFRIEIPESTPYGIFARSCVAMAKDSRSTFQIIDDDGCPVEPSIFPQFKKDGYALQSVYEAFRFTESYGVIFQCNVKYCLGLCEPARCQSGRETVLSWGRKKRDVTPLGRRIREANIRKARDMSSMKSVRGHVQETTKEEAMAAAEAMASVSSSNSDEMSISQEILVLDLGDEQSPQYRDPHPQPNRSYRNNSTYTYEGADVTLFETCPTRSSVLALAVTCAILLLIYVLTVFYFVMRKWIRPTKNVR
ncbi:hypothetical protein Pcinc_030252 [Petrolisthes cinctipes]|uniref:ZP domain-containing protein n=1 Tax=Petrolisthes cinctipes TaxID=88211 RepID=A0AAE1EYR1_PETCI|nr:hypothetical protein Pcinc_030252 [Petrolisthes cinctipes]